MPIYEYLCGECRHKFEKIVLGTLTGPFACPKCGGARVERLVSRFATASKGGGGGSGDDFGAGEGFGGDMSDEGFGGPAGESEEGEWGGPEGDDDGLDGDDGEDDD